MLHFVVFFNKNLFLNKNTNYVFYGSLIFIVQNLLYQNVLLGPTCRINLTSPLTLITPRVFAQQPISPRVQKCPTPSKISLTNPTRSKLKGSLEVLFPSTERPLTSLKSLMSAFYVMTSL